jgi:hypothetical protein
MLIPGRTGAVPLYFGTVVSTKLNNTYLPRRHFLFLPSVCAVPCRTHQLFPRAKARPKSKSKPKPKTRPTARPPSPCTLLYRGLYKHAGTYDSGRAATRSRTKARTKTELLPTSPTTRTFKNSASSSRSSVCWSRGNQTRCTSGSGTGTRSTRVAAGAA